MEKEVENSLRWPAPGRPQRLREVVGGPPPSVHGCLPLTNKKKKMRRKRAASSPAARARRRKRKRATAAAPLPDPRPPLARRPSRPAHPPPASPSAPWAPPPTTRPPRIRKPPLAPCCARPATGTRSQKTGARPAAAWTSLPAAAATGAAGAATWPGIAPPRWPPRPPAPASCAAGAGTSGPHARPSGATGAASPATWPGTVGWPRQHRKQRRHLLLARRPAPGAGGRPARTGAGRGRWRNAGHPTRPPTARPRSASCAGWPAISRVVGVADRSASRRSRSLWWARPVTCAAGAGMAGVSVGVGVGGGGRWKRRRRYMKCQPRGRVGVWNGCGRQSAHSAKERRAPGQSNYH